MGRVLLPAHPIDRQRVRALSYAVAMDIHPVCNLGVVARVMAGAGDGEAARREWMQKFIGEGLAAFERMLDHPATGAFCHGDRPTMADLCLVPQVYNARRWDVDLAACPLLVAIDRRCAGIDAFPEGASRPRKTLDPRRDAISSFRTSCGLFRQADVANGSAGRRSPS